jgi:hypothetical protein
LLGQSLLVHVRRLSNTQQAAVVVEVVIMDKKVFTGIPYAKRIKIVYVCYYTTPEV